MAQSAWDARILPLQGLILNPFCFNDLRITLIDAVNAFHEKGWATEEHRHPWFEFNYVSEGCLYTTMDGREFLTEQGSFFIVPPGIFHSNRSSSIEQDDGFCLRWQLEHMRPSEEAADCAGISGNILQVLSHTRSFSEKGAFVEEFARDIQNTQSMIKLQLQLVNLIIALYELWNREMREEIRENTREQVLVQQALLYLSEYYPSHIAVQDLANSLNISYRHLARIFKQATGVTIIEKLNDIRINEAKKLLKDTDRPVREVAAAVGFENEYYFSNIFSHHAYVSPSGFRSRFRK